MLRAISVALLVRGHFAAMFKADETGLINASLPLRRRNVWAEGNSCRNQVDNPPYGRPGSILHYFMAMVLQSIELESTVLESASVKLKRLLNTSS